MQLGHVLSAILATITFLPSLSIGQTVSWTNPDGGSWTNAANWDGDAPTSSSFDAIVDLIASENYFIDANFSTPVGNITLNSDQASVEFFQTLIADNVTVSAGRLELNDGWDISGNFDIENGGQLALSFDFSTADLANVNLQDGASFQANGLWDNTGSTYTLNENVDYFFNAFGGGEFQNGILNTNSHLITTNGTTSFINTTINGDLQLAGISGSFFGRVDFEGGSLNGGLTVTNRLQVGFDAGADTSNLSFLDLNDEGAFVDFRGLNGDFTWGTGKNISGSGTVLAAQSGNTFTHEGTAVANVNDEFLQIGSSGVMLNEGTLEADNGGKLVLFGSTIRNGASGVIRVREDSQLWLNPSQEFENLGSIVFEDNTALVHYGTYEAEDIDQTLAPATTTVLLTGNLVLQDNEPTFTPSSNFAFDNDSTVTGGSIDFSNIEMGNLLGGELISTTVNGDMYVPDASTMTLSGAEVLGTTVVDGGSLEMNAGSLISGDIEVRNSGSLLMGRSSNITGDIRIDGTDATFIANNTELGSQGSLITLVDGGTIETSTGVLKTNAGTTVTGNGRINLVHDNDVSFAFSNSGIIEVVGADGRIEIFDDEPGVSNIKFTNFGTVIARDGGQLVFTDDIYRQFGSGELLLDNGSVTSNELFAQLGGVVRGSGTIAAPGIELNGGELSVGVEIGRLDLIGDVLVLPVGSDVAMLFDIAGLQQGVAGGHDFLSIDGNLTIFDSSVGLGRLLQVNTLGDLALADLEDAELTIIELADSHQLTGVFSNVENGGLLASEDGRFEFNVFYGDGSSYGSNRVVLTNFRLSAVPEPSALLLLTMTSMIMLTRRKKS